MRKSVIRRAAPLHVVSVNSEPVVGSASAAVTKVAGSIGGGCSDGHHDPISTYEAVYRDPSKKKNGSLDGRLVVTPSCHSIALFDDNGKLLVSRALRKEDAVETGRTLKMGKWELDVGEACDTTATTATIATAAVTPAPPTAMRAAAAARPATARPAAPKPAARGFNAPLASAVREDAFVLNRTEHEQRPVVVDRQLSRALRPHQRDGVQFMYSCVMGTATSHGALVKKVY